MNITSDFRLTFDVDDFAIAFSNVTHSNVGNITVGVLNLITKTMSTAVVSMLDKLGAKGIPLQSILDYLHLKWLDLRDTKIETLDGYFKLCSNPYFNFTK